MRIVFVGTVEFSQHCLKEVLKNGGNVVAVYTLRKSNAGFHSDYTDLSNVAIRYQIPHYEVENINDSTVMTQLRSLAPDVIFVFGWSQLISKEILDIPPLGCVGSHPALLPKNRGRHPLIWALIEGLKESGLTFFYLDVGVDSGDILWQRSFPIIDQDDASSLYEKIKILASEAIREFLPQLEKGTAPRIPQDQSLATYWPKRTESDGEINWSMPTQKIYNLVRALAKPYPGAHTYIHNEKMLIQKAEIQTLSLPSAAFNLKPGMIFDSNGSQFNVRTQDGSLTILEYKLPDKTLVQSGIQLGKGS